MIEKINERSCTGCKMCEDMCMQKAITFQEDTEGFWYPKVNIEKCTLCGLCVQKCIGLYPFSSNSYTVPEVYAFWLKDTKMRRYSTSGGAYYAFAKKIFAEGGAIVACRFTEDWKHAEHIVVENEKMLLETVTSKYFQSDAAGVYKKVKGLLKQNRKVLFSGTPCQSAALQRYLGEEHNTLITMDFICRGVNSPKVYRAFIAELEKKYQSSVKNVHFKHKRKGWQSLGTLIEFENGKEYFETSDNSYWVKGYVKDNLYMRPACYECRYRTIPRCSDFTVGDFWGIRDIGEDEMINGISVVFANSERARKFLTELDGVELKKRTLDEALSGNPCILHSPKEGIHRKDFFELIEKMYFSQAVMQCSL